MPSHLATITAYLRSRSYHFEIIVVDDGSTDSTAAIVDSLSEQDPRIQCLRLQRNSGKGAAVKVGMLAAKGALRLFTDADGATPISELERLEAAVSNGADVAIASRALPDDSRQIQGTLHRKIMGTVFNLIVNTFTVRGFRDTQCGFKMFTAAAAESVFPLQRINDFGFDVEILFLSSKRGYRIVEVPVNWRDVGGSKVRLVEDSIRMFLDVLKVRLFHMLGFYQEPRPVRLGSGNSDA